MVRQLLRWLRRIVNREFLVKSRRQTAARLEEISKEVEQAATTFAKEIEALEASLRRKGR